jgi:L-cysteine:1D-myo-inositol 2-amino-2-deoxy-alpha-D-glucopyranoside ligase
VLAEVRDALSDDLDTTTALAAVDRWAARTLEAPAAGEDPEAPGLARRLVDALLGIAL